jgi:uncharacterized membrane protein YkoI
MVSVMEESMKTSTVVAIAVATLAVASGAAQAQTGTLSMERARAIALSRVSHNEGVLSSKLKTRGGILVYEFDIETAGPGHREVRVDAHTGAVVEDVHEDDLIGGAAEKASNMADKAAKASAKEARKAAKEADKVFSKDEVAKMNMPISEDQAGRIALRRAGSGKVKDVDLEMENGRYVWEVDVDTSGKGHQEILVDAHSGRVLEQVVKK